MTQADRDLIDAMPNIVTTLLGMATDQQKPPHVRAEARKILREHAETIRENGFGSMIDGVLDNGRHTG